MFSLESLLTNSNPHLFFVSLSFHGIIQSLVIYVIVLSSYFYPHVSLNIPIKV